MSSSAPNNLAKDFAELDIHDVENEKKTSQARDDPFRGVIRSNHRARDITEEFAKASSALHVGQLIKDETFTLFDSVQALELMDPKMDTGYLGPGESLEDDYDVCKPLLPAEVLGIMDQLLCYQISWLSGFPLAQNLFSCLYIDHLLAQNRDQKTFPKFTPVQGIRESEPGDLVQLVLRAYCIGIIKSCDVTIEMIQSQHYFEEEDFNTHTFNRNLLSDIDDEDCLELIAEAEQWVSKQPSLKGLIGHAFRTRLELCRTMYQIVLPTLNEGRSKEQWTELQHIVKHIEESHELGRPVPEAFSVKIQRRLASTVPPRPIVQVEFKDACERLGALFRDIEEAHRVSVLNTVGDMDCLITFLFAYSTRAGGPSTLARAILQCLILSEGRMAGIGSGIEALIVNLIQKSAPDDSGWLQEANWRVEKPSDSRFKAARLVDWYIEQSTPEYTNMIRALCQNPCRIRRCLTNVVRDFDVLHQEVVHKIFNDKTPTNISDVAGDKIGDLKWTIWHTSQRVEWRILEWVNRLGFELDIYRPDEYSYLYHYLAKQINARLDSLEETEAEVSIIIKASDAKLAAIPKEDHTAYVSMAERIRNQILVCRATATLADGLFQVYSIRDLLTTLAAPPRPQPYNHPTLYTEAREKPFSHLKFGIPPPLTAGQWHAEAQRAAKLPSDSSGDGKGLNDRIAGARATLQRAGELFKEVLRAGTRDAAAVDAVGSEEAWRGGTQAALRACIAAVVSVSRLAQGLKGAGGDEDAVVWAGRVRVVEGRHRAGCWVVPDIVVE